MVYIIIISLTAVSIFIIIGLYNPNILKTLVIKGSIKPNQWLSINILPNNILTTLKETLNKIKYILINTVKYSSIYFKLNPAYLTSFFIIFITASICYWLINHSLLDVYHPLSTESKYNQQVNLLLAGEKLQPPSAPPQELFAKLDAEIDSQKAQQVEEGYWTNKDPIDALQNFSRFTDSEAGLLHSTENTGVTDLSSATNNYNGDVSNDRLTTHINNGYINIKNADRNWQKMNSEFVQRLLAVYKIMNDQYGYEMVLLEGYRSPGRQARLLAKGPSVTKAGSYRSYHQFGLAGDSAFIKNGKIVISEGDPWAMKGYRIYGRVAKSVGLTWGGDWKMMDLGHVQLTKKGVLGHPEMAKVLTTQ